METQFKHLTADELRPLVKNAKKHFGNCYLGLYIDQYTGELVAHRIEYDTCSFPRGMCYFKIKEYQSIKKQVERILNELYY